MNEETLEQLNQVQDKKIEIVPNATHLFEEPGALERVARLAASWFSRYLGSQTARGSYLRPGVN